MQLPDIQPVPPADDSSERSGSPLRRIMHSPAMYRILRIGGPIVILILVIAIILRAAAPVREPVIEEPPSKIPSSAITKEQLATIKTNQFTPPQETAQCLEMAKSEQDKTNPYVAVEYLADAPLATTSVQSAYKQQFKKEQESASSTTEIDDQGLLLKAETPDLYIFTHSYTRLTTNEGGPAIAAQEYRCIGFLKFVDQRKLRIKTVTAQSVKYFFDRTIATTYAGQPERDKYSPTFVASVATESYDAVTYHYFIDNPRYATCTSSMRVDRVAAGTECPYNATYADHGGYIDRYVVRISKTDGRYGVADTGIVASGITHLTYGGSNIRAHIK